jgi:hypothetical protein
MNIQTQITDALCDHEFNEDASERIYRSMRFEREGDTPEWQAGGNSLAQDEARACLASVVEFVRSALADMEASE